MTINLGWPDGTVGYVTTKTIVQKLLDRTSWWLKPERHDAEVMIDSIILEQLTLSLSESVEVWVRRHHPRSLDPVVKLTEEYVEADLPRKEPHKGGRKMFEEPQSSKLGKAKTEANKGALSTHLGVTSAGAKDT